MLDPANVDLRGRVVGGADVNRAHAVKPVAEAALELQIADAIEADLLFPLAQNAASDQELVIGENILGEDQGRPKSVRLRSLQIVLFGSFAMSITSLFHVIPR